MSWSDDEWDADDADKKLEAKLEADKKKAKEYSSSDSEKSEDEKKSSEDEKPPAKEEKPAAKAKGKAKAKAKEKKKEESDEEDSFPALGSPSKAKAKPKAAKKKAAPKAAAEADVPLADPVAEKKRLEKAVKDADAKIAEDLFADCPKPKKEVADEGTSASSAAAVTVSVPKVQYVTIDAFDKLELKTQGDVESLCTRCSDKIVNSKTLKAGAALKFVYDLVKVLEPDLTKEDLLALDKSLAAIIKEKKVSKTEVEANKRKQNEKLSKNTKFNAQDEMSVVYGGAAEGDYWGDEGWEEGYDY